jgi:hypothetical protein
MLLRLVLEKKCIFFHATLLLFVRNQQNGPRWGLVEAAVAKTGRNAIPPYPWTRRWNLHGLPK